MTHPACSLLLLILLLGESEMTRLILPGLRRTQNNLRTRIDDINNSLFNPTDALETRRRGQYADINSGYCTKPTARFTSSVNAALKNIRQVAAALCDRATRSM